jgi:hypothetical protein
MWWITFRRGDVVILRATSLIHARMLAALSSDLVNPRILLRATAWTRSRRRLSPATELAECFRAH